MTETTEELMASRELDAMVAERVMGFSWEAEAPPGGRFLRTPLGWPAAYIPSGDPRPTYTSHLPCFSTDIAAAHLVIAKLGETRRIDLHWMVGTGEWIASIDDFQFEEWGGYAGNSERAATLPLAVARLATKWAHYLATRAAQTEG